MQRAVWSDLHRLASLLMTRYLLGKFETWHGKVEGLRCSTMVGITRVLRVALVAGMRAGMLYKKKCKCWRWLDMLDRYEHSECVRRKLCRAFYAGHMSYLDCSLSMMYLVVMQNRHV